MRKLWFLLTVPLVAAGCVVPHDRLPPASKDAGESGRGAGGELVFSPDGSREASEGASGGRTPDGVTCASSLECSPPTPHCLPIDHVCAQCLSNQNCDQTGSRFCDPETHACVGCLHDSQCTATRPFCGPEGVCVECLSTTNCGASGFACDPQDHDCTAVCVRDADCIDPKRPFCNLRQGLCEQCLIGTDCPASAPFCDTETGICFQCEDDGECAAPTPRCHAKSRACVECLTGTDCSSDEECRVNVCVLVAR